MLVAVGTLTGVVLSVSLWAYAQLRSSLPLLEGTVTASHLSAPVAVTRDAHGGVVKLTESGRTEENPTTGWT